MLMSQLLTALVHMMVQEYWEAQPDCIFKGVILSNSYPGGLQNTLCCHITRKTPLPENTITLLHSSFQFSTNEIILQ